MCVWESEKEIFVCMEIARTWIPLDRQNGNLSLILLLLLHPKLSIHRPHYCCSLAFWQLNAFTFHAYIIYSVNSVHFLFNCDNSEMFYFLLLFLLHKFLQEAFLKRWKISTTNINENVFFFFFRNAKFIWEQNCRLLNLPLVAEIFIWIISFIFDTVDFNDFEMLINHSVYINCPVRSFSLQIKKKRSAILVYVFIWKWELTSNKPKKNEVVGFFFLSL